HDGGAELQGRENVHAQHPRRVDVHQAIGRLQSDVVTLQPRSGVGLELLQHAIETRQPQTILQVFLVVRNGAGGNIVASGGPVGKPLHIHAVHRVVHRHRLHRDILVAGAHDERHVGLGGDIGIRGTVDHDFGAYELAARFAFDNDSRNGSV